MHSVLYMFVCVCIYIDMSVVCMCVWCVCFCLHLVICVCDLSCSVIATHDNTRKRSFVFLFFYPKIHTLTRERINTFLQCTRRTHQCSFTSAMNPTQSSPCSQAQSKSWKLYRRWSCYILIPKVNTSSRSW